MTFRDNLQHLRGTRSMSQADLAQELGVSRQSVAKWEAEKSYPEIDKLIKLCDLFDCSLDDLVRGDLAGEGRVEASDAGAALTPADASPVETALEVPTTASARAVDVYGYDEHMRSRAWSAAAAVAAIVVSIGADLFVTGGHAYGSLPASLSVYLIGIVIALALTVPTYQAHRAFQREHPCIEDFYAPDRKADAHRRKGMGIALGVGLVVAGMFSPALFQSYYAAQFGSLSLFCLLAAAAGVIVYAVMMDYRVDVSSYNAAAARVAAGEPGSDPLGEFCELCRRLKNAVLVELRR